jgi:hypothetical protein
MHLLTTVNIRNFFLYEIKVWLEHLAHHLVNNLARKAKDPKKILYKFRRFLLRLRIEKDKMKLHVSYQFQSISKRQ